MQTEALQKLLKENPALYKALMAQVACEKSLYKFTETMWEFVEPANPFIPGWHMEVICDHLEAVFRGDITRLLINVPPGMAKSILLSVFFPAWCWIHRPSHRFLCTSYSAGLTERDNIRFRQVITSDLYSSMWGDRFGFSRDSFNITKMGNNKTGWKIASSTSGLGTGERADVVICIPFMGMILSSDGWLRIGDIVEKRLPVKIAGWDGDKIIWQDIDAYEKNPFRQIIELDFGDGCLRCTEDHLVFTSRGYIAAKDITCGDEVWSFSMETMPRVRSHDFRQAMQNKEQEILSEEMQNNGRKENCDNRKQQTMHSMRSNDLPLSGAFKKNAEDNILQSQMPRYMESREKQSGICERQMEKVPSMQKIISEASSRAKILFIKMLRTGSTSTLEKMRSVQNPFQTGECKLCMLLHEVLEHSPFNKIARLWQWKVYSWRVGKALSTRMESCPQTDNIEARQESVHGVWNDEAISQENTSCASYRLREGEYKSNESDNALPVLSRRNARKSGSASALEKRIIKSVKKISKKERATYNLRVNPCHNYFADGILVHNCDDLHNVKDGESDAVRKSTLQYFAEVLPTRLTNPISSAIVVIMQRVHEEDVAGYIISKDLGYDHVLLPMEYESGYPSIPTSLGFTDPRTIEGELLFPDRFPREVVERDKKVMGSYAVSGQFQQRPVPRGGGIIKSDYWKLWPEDGEEFLSTGEPVRKMEYPVMDYIIASVDTAYTSKTSSDFNACAILGLWRKMGLPKIMLMQAWQKRLDFRGETLPRLPDETDAEYNARRKKGWGMLEWTAHECKRFDVDKLLIEGKATGITLAQEIRKIYNNERWATQLINPKGDKEARVYSVQHIWAEGMVYAPERAWAQEAIDECAKFPKGAHDDIVDAIVQGVRWFRDSGWALRSDEVKAEDKDRNKYVGGKSEPLYPA